MQKVTGIGGVFLKANNPKVLAAWYEQHLGIPFGNNAFVAFDWKSPNPEAPGSTSFCFFDKGSDYFAPSTATAMINFRVHDLDALLSELKAAGIWVDENVQTFDYGKFGYCMDPEGNKLELWQPA